MYFHQMPFDGITIAPYTLSVYRKTCFVIVFSIHVTSYGTAVNYIPLSGYAWDPYIVKGRHCKLLAQLDYSMAIASLKMAGL